MNVEQVWKTFALVFPFNKMWIQKSISSFSKLIAMASITYKLQFFYLFLKVLNLDPLEYKLCELQSILMKCEVLISKEAEFTSVRLFFVNFTLKFLNVLTKINSRSITKQKRNVLSILGKYIHCFSVSLYLIDK